MGKKNRKSSKKHSSGDAEIEDERFAAAQNRPHFLASAKAKNNNNSDNKIVLDERFSSVLTDPRFQLQEKDRYGRKKKNKGKKINNELKEFYTVAENEKGKDAEKPPKKEDKEDDASSTSSSSSSDSNSDNEKERDADPTSRISYLTALSRGELDVSSSSCSDDEVDSDEDSSDDSSVEGEDPVHGTPGVLDPSTKQEEEVEITYEQSPYVAVTNLDWSQVRATDIFAILSSFAPPGSLKRVQVFVSDFGKEKMAHELEHGPPSLWKKKKDKKKQSTESDEGSDEEEHNSDDDGGGDQQNNDEADKDNEDGIDSEDDDSEVDYKDMTEEQYADFLQSVKEQQMQNESDFDPEKLRAYEASKLKYYFAVAEFENAAAADMAYKEVDGMELEHSSAAVDMRSIPAGAIDEVVKDRELRDEATSLPGNYEPPDFIVSALQQTNVQCSWEAGDNVRERMLTKYSSAEQWASMAEGDDLKAYLASDNSSDEDSDNDSDAPNAKGAKLRKLLGLDADSDDEEVGEDPLTEHDDESATDNEEQEEQEVSKEIRYVPGKQVLQEKIRNKLENNKKDTDELTPWEKYQQKRKEKRRERRQAARRKRSDVVEDDKEKSSKSKHRIKDNFFMDDDDDSDKEDSDKHKPSKEELELLLAGDNDEEVARDFDMRGLRRIDRIKDKKLSKGRKRKEEKITAEVSGKDFAIDLKDSRFAAVLDGADGRFGIDRTDPQYKETPAMRRILDEQRERRKKKRKKTSHDNPKAIPPNVVEGSSQKSAGSAALSSLVKSLKTKVQ